MSTFSEAFENITKSRHYEPVSTTITNTPSQTSPPKIVVAGGPVAIATNHKAILANPRQKANPILKHVRSVPIEFSSDIHMPADFSISQTNGMLYLSIKYHKLNPEYLIGRMEAMRRQFKLRIVLVQVDDIDCEGALLRIQALCVANGFTTICAFGEEEAARYLETYKLFEKKSSEEIEERKNADYLSRATDALTQVRAVNKSDVKNLLRNFRSVGAVMEAPMENFALCAGIGEKKVARMYAAFNEPFFASSVPQSLPRAERDVPVDIVVADGPINVEEEEDES